jgi:YggT family protein
MDIICALLTIYWLILLLRIAASWFPAPTSGFGQQAIGLLWSLTEPVLRPFRGLFPPVRMGGASLDLSALAPFLIIMIVQRIIC